MNTTDLGKLGSERSHLMIDTLYKQGIKHFCLAPGSRSTPLAIAISEHPFAKKWVHFDERGLGFFALGLAKASQEPVVILTTTGTAVGNLFPAVMEAHASHIPLFILSADRPAELRECGANQTADHVKMFGSYIRFDKDMPLSDPLCSDAYIVSSLAYALDRCRKTPKGPVHINCQIREPSFSLASNKVETPHSCIYEPKISVPPESSFKSWAQAFSTSRKGIILLGSGALESEDEIEDLLQIAETLGWPIFSDIISGGRQIGDHPLHIPYFELILKAYFEERADCILQIGNRFVSKPLLQWLEKQEAPYFLVTDHPFRQDPLHKVSRKMECSAATFCKSIIPFLSEQEGWIRFWQNAASIVKKEVFAFFRENTLFSEPSLFHYLSQQTKTAIYLSSSMPIRDANLLFFPKNGSEEIFSNRGVSGIDGNVATALGACQALEKPLIALLGDLATLHDLNSFALLQKTKTPMISIIINNQGGAIFSFLPIAQKKDLFEEFIATSHSYCFDSIASLFSLPYEKADNQNDFEKALQKAFASKKSCIIECQTIRSENKPHHDALYQKVINALCSTVDSMEIKILQ